MLAVVRAIMRLELDGPGYLAGEPTAWRRLVLGAAGDAGGRENPLPTLTESDPGEWGLLLEEVQSRLFWDADWEMADDFLDLPPEAAAGLLDLHGIDPDYFQAVPDDLEGVAVEAARRDLARLTGRRAPGRSGP